VKDPLEPSSPLLLRRRGDVSVKSDISRRLAHRIHDCGFFCIFLSFSFSWSFKRGLGKSCFQSPLMTSYVQEPCGPPPPRPFFLLLLLPLLLQSPCCRLWQYSVLFSRVAVASTAAPFVFLLLPVPNNEQNGRWILEVAILLELAVCAALSFSFPFFSFPFCIGYAQSRLMAKETPRRNDELCAKDRGLPPPLSLSFLSCVITVCTPDAPPPPYHSTRHSDLLLYFPPFLSFL